VAVKVPPPLGKALYGSLFAVAVPALLFTWARATKALVSPPTPSSRPGGALLASAGGCLMVAAVLALRRRGGGLPMNAYPPPRFVDSGIYRHLSHPLYTGFCLACLGISIAAGSASGFWLVTPAVALGCTALVWGYEKQDLAARFGATLPAAVSAEERPLLRERIAVYVKVFLPWVALYELFAWFPLPGRAAVASLPFETRLPVWQWTEFIYASTYPVVAGAPLLAATRGDLRRFALRGRLAMAILFALYALVPLVSPPRAFVPDGVPGDLLRWERRLDTAAAAFPSFHVVWAMLAAPVYARRMPRLRALCWIWAIAVAASCVTTGMHALADVAAGLGAAALVLSSGRIWNRLRLATEEVANSWREWRLGRIRIINHGAWAGIGTFLGLSLLGTLVGPGHLGAIALASAAGLVGAALWAQFIEGSPQLLRPYGYYGGIFAVMIASLAAPLLGTPTWLLLGGFSVAGPVIQAFGRVRCLVQGCCHGAPAPAGIGIVYRHPRSRVCRLAELAGVPIHATPLYSILWNVAVEAVMIRLWLAGSPLHLIGGAYLILTGLGRFVEEAYRGEPQTPVLAGLRLYQWVAVGTVALGALLTAVGRSGPAPMPRFDWPSIALAAGVGMVCAAALGIDFPESSRRYSRLA
jgi:protein-S-isoprenylcysteine O-methyltransferase Ste14